MRCSLDRTTKRSAHRGLEPVGAILSTRDGGKEWAAAGTGTAGYCGELVACPSITVCFQAASYVVEKMPASDAVIGDRFVRRLESRRSP